MSSLLSEPVDSAGGLHVHFHLTIPPLVTETLMGAAKHLRLFPELPEPPKPTESALAAQDAPSCAAGVGTASSSLRLHEPGSAAEQALRVLESLAAPEADVMPQLDEAGRQAAARLSLGEYYETHLLRWRESQVATKTLAVNTFRGERDHCRAFARWDSGSVPANWPDGVAWRGCPLSHLTGSRLWEFFDSKVRGGEWKPATAKSRWNHLRVVLKFALKQGVIAQVPTLAKFERRLDDVRSARVPDGDDEDDDAAVPYTDGELGKLYAALPDIVASAIADGTVKARSQRHLAELRTALVDEMRAAIVLIGNVGPRASDWTRFEFARQIRLDCNPPECVFVAEKTGKKHRIPLAEPTVAHLRFLKKSQAQLPGMEGHLFPHLVNVRAKNTRKSEPYRRSVKLLKAATVSFGLDADQFRCPWHAIRKSCNTRFNTHGIASNLGMIGHLLTHGPDADVASQSYDNRWPSVVKAVATIAWPAEFYSLGSHGVQ